MAVSRGALAPLTARLQANLPALASPLSSGRYLTGWGGFLINNSHQPTGMAFRLQLVSELIEKGEGKTFKATDDKFVISLA